MVVMSLCRVEFEVWIKKPVIIFQHSKSWTLDCFDTFFSTLVDVPMNSLESRRPATVITNLATAALSSHNMILVDGRETLKVNVEDQIRCVLLTNYPKTRSIMRFAN